MKRLTEDLVNGVLKDAQNADLESLIDNDDKLIELIADSEITKSLKRKREELSEFNRDQATRNLSLKPDFDLLKSTLGELAQKQNELRDRYVTLQSRLGSTLSSDTVLSLLQVAAGEQETLSEDVKTNFYDGDLTVDEFIKNFVEGRKLYQLRKIKSDKLKVLLQQPQQVAPMSRPGRPAPPVPGGVPRPAVGMGYPGQSVYGARYPGSYPR